MCTEVLGAARGVAPNHPVSALFGVLSFLEEEEPKCREVEGQLASPSITPHPHQKRKIACVISPPCAVSVCVGCARHGGAAAPVPRGARTVSRGSQPAGAGPARRPVGGPSPPQSHAPPPVAAQQMARGPGGRPPAGERMTGAGLWCRPAREGPVWSSRAAFPG